jgi:hypothetical protein
MSEKTRIRIVSTLVFAATMLTVGGSAYGFDLSPAPVPGDANDSARVRITETRSYWTSFMGGGGFVLQPESDLFESRDGLFVVAGRLQNRSDRALDHVELLFELLDADGKVVASQEGFNRRAEALFDDEEDAAIEAIPAGGDDSYRMIFFGDEIPSFKTPRVSVRRAVFAPR